jgi:class 3 adenylate cyclase
MAEHANRTFICSVLFLDIAEYSRRSVAEQIRLKEKFNKVLKEAIAGVATDDRIILDTGDGAAVSFLGDPEDAMFASLSLRDAIAGQDATGGPPLQIRVGINLGPVRLVKDINGQPNIIGDGINVAQRVMSFADPGQILVSRSYYDVMARLSEDYSQLFHYEGAKTDKHVREHEVYAISTAPSTLRRSHHAASPGGGVRLPNFRFPRVRFRFPDFRFPKISLPSLKIPGLSLQPLRTLATALDVNSKLLVAAPLVFVLIVGTAIAARGFRHPVRAEAPAPQTQPRAAAAKVEPREIVAQVEPPAAKASDGGTPPNSGRARSNTRRPATPPKAKPVLVAKAKSGESPSKPKGSDAPSASGVSGANAVVNFSALPWAEVYVDGARQGVSPPLHTVSVAPGKHQIELRNSSFPPHVETIDARPGTQINIKHRFRK